LAKNRFVGTTIRSAKYLALPRLRRGRAFLQMYCDAKKLSIEITRYKQTGVISPELEKNITAIAAGIGRKLTYNTDEFVQTCWLKFLQLDLDKIDPERNNFNYLTTVFFNEFRLMRRQPKYEPVVMDFSSDFGLFKPTREIRIETKQKTRDKLLLVNGEYKVKINGGELVSLNSYQGELSSWTIRTRLANGWDLKKAMRPVTRYVFEINGQKKTLREIAEERGKSYHQIYNLLRSGRSVFDPIRSNSKIFVNGVTLTEISNETCIDYQCLYYRWRTGKELTKSIKEPIRFIKYKEKTQSLGDWAKELKIKKSTISSRLLRGWPVEKALTPVRKYVKKEKQKKQEH